MIGQRLGQFQIQSLLGAGGMGEVYRAHDSKLGRVVALKVLPPLLTNDPDRLARFEREARVLASLNHPNIGAIYGLEEWPSESGPRCALVLDLVEGETLAEWIANSIKAGSIGQPASVATALNYARQLAEALDVAHERGIIHRDLKPANIKVTPDGVVKVLDFGLAKALEISGSSGTDNSSIDPAQSPTAAAMTLHGQILGTPTYMSPEQARGRAVDKRTDVWAFGCVVYELLTGRAPFRGETVSDTIAAVLGREPDWTALPSTTPTGVVRLLRRCLEKDRKRRLRDLGDADLALEAEPAAPISARPISSVQWRWIWGAAMIPVAILAAGIVVLMTWRPPDAALSRIDPMRFEITPAASLSDSGQFSISPDGRHLVYAGTGSDGVLRLWVRSFGETQTRPLLGTEADVVQAIPPMIWSPDSRYIAFFSAAGLKKVDRQGGVSQIVCTTPGVAVGGSWNRDDVILLGNTAGGILRCPAAGGAATPVTRLADSTKDIDHMMPSFLPDGRHFIYSVFSRADPANDGVYIGDLSSAPEQQSTTRLIATGFGSAYAPGMPGHGYVLFVRDRALLASAFDETTLSAIGDPVPVASSVGAFRDTAFFSVSKDELIFREPPPDYQLTWLDRKGATVGSIGEPAGYVDLGLSPDGTRVLAGRESLLNRADRDLRIVDAVRNTTTRLTSDSLPLSDATFSADGKQVYFASASRKSDLKRKAADGSGSIETVLEEGMVGLPINLATLALSPTPDSRALVVTVAGSAKTRFDLWLLPLTPDTKAVPLIEQNFDQSDGQFSPDYRWLAYVSNESGIDEVFARRVTIDQTTGRVTLGASIVVSRGGGTSPRWRRDSKELFYLARSGAMMSAAVGSDIGSPTALFQRPAMLTQWEVSPDGKRFLVATPTRQSSQTLTVVLNWQNGLKR
jgi:serine/threonine protein kinase/Tol biopolymer transport system component